MNRRPVIGITTDHNSRTTPEGVVHDQYLLPHPYSIAVEMAGGLPVLLPYRSSNDLVARYVDLCDGFVLSGGNDYDPGAWGEQRHPQAVPTDPERERFERALIAEIERRAKPVLGICGGCQIMNIHRGGSLHQFLPDLGTGLEHRRATIEEWSRRHEVALEPGSRHARLIGKGRVSSNTSHKQSINRLGRGLVITARATDGIVEGVEDPGLPFFVAVQWHPERQYDDPDHLALFQDLVRHASR